MAESRYPEVMVPFRVHNSHHWAPGELPPVPTCIPPVLYHEAAPCSLLLWTEGFLYKCCDGSLTPLGPARRRGCGSTPPALPRHNRFGGT